jgi:hypothetical protein
MRTALVVLALIAAGAARAQPAPPSEALQKGLFGEREPEPGDEEVAAGQVEPAAPAPAAPSTADYDARVRQSFAAAESFQGPLDGGWVASGDGRDLLSLQLSDKGDGRIEGAWRDLLSPSTPRSSGLISQVIKSGDEIELQFGEQQWPFFHKLTLRRSAAGVWQGRYRRGDEVFPIVLQKAP